MVFDTSHKPPYKALNTELTQFNPQQLVSIYKFKAFKKNLRFKKYNLGITKFIKNRKKYIIRKRKTSNILSYVYLYAWAKYYMLQKQSIRYSHCFLFGNYSLVSVFLPVNTTSIALNRGETVNYSSISKKVFFNTSLFEKKTLLFFKKLFLNKRVYFFYAYNLTSSSDLVNLTSDSVHFYRIRKVAKGLPFNLYLYESLLKALLLIIYQVIISLRKTYILLIMSFKFLN